MDSRKIVLNAYRVAAYVTGVGLIILTCYAMPMKYIWGNSTPVAIVGAAHGFLYMIYVVLTLVLAERCRWSPVRAVLIALAGTVPFVSFYAERKVTGWVKAQIAAQPRGAKAGSARAAERAADQQSDLSA
jgi:integral membrane protein